MAMERTFAAAGGLLLARPDPTGNGALFLGLQSRIGSLGEGMDADIVVVKGSRHINDIENVETVFKDGVGYDTRKLLDSVKGHHSQY
jgi:cytosine/adenosine deaminase-related metal-dependent hydrolase